PWARPIPEAQSLSPAAPVPLGLETTDAVHTVPTAETPAGSRADVARLARRTQRLAQYERARALRDDGYTWAVVAQQVGVPPRTLRSWCARAGFPARTRRTGDRRSLAPSRASLQPRWEAGEHSATPLWHAVRAQ